MAVSLLALFFTAESLRSLQPCACVQETVTNLSITLTTDSRCKHGCVCLRACLGVCAQGSCENTYPCQLRMRMCITSVHACNLMEPEFVTVRHVQRLMSGCLGFKGSADLQSSANLHFVFGCTYDHRGDPKWRRATLVVVIVLALNHEENINPERIKGDRKSILKPKLR